MKAGKKGSFSYAATLLVLIALGALGWSIWTYFNQSGTPPQGQAVDRSVHPDVTPRKSSVQERHDALGPWESAPVVDGHQVPSDGGVVWIRGNGEVTRSAKTLSTPRPWITDDTIFSKIGQYGATSDNLIIFETITGVKAVVHLNQPFVLDSDSDNAYRFASLTGAESVSLK